MKHSRSSALLVELIIAIFFFSLASAACIQMFAKSHLLSKKTVNENYSSVWTQNLAECFIATEGNLRQISLYLNGDYTDDGMVILYFDKNWEQCSYTDAYYGATLTQLESTGNLIRCNIDILAFADSPDPIYSLELIHHIPFRKADINE